VSAPPPVARNRHLWLISGRKTGRKTEGVMTGSDVLLRQEDEAVRLLDAMPRDAAKAVLDHVAHEAVRNGCSKWKCSDNTTHGHLET
jgi:hypothetical protein